MAIVGSKANKASIPQGALILAELARCMEKHPDGIHGRYIAAEDSDERVADRLGNGITFAMIETRRKAMFGPFLRVPSEASKKRQERAAKADETKKTAYQDIADRMDRVVEILNNMKAHFDDQILKLIDRQDAHVKEVRQLVAEINTRIAGVERAAIISTKPYSDAVAATRIPSGQSNMGGQQPVLAFGKER